MGREKFASFLFGGLSRIGLRLKEEAMLVSREFAGAYRCSLLLAALLTILFAATAESQRNHSKSAPKYDPSTEMKTKGIVEDVKLPPKGSEQDIAYLLMKDGAEILDVYLCPKSFLDDMGVSFTKGTEIALVGSKVKENGSDLILAREVVNGNDTVVLRDDKGNPVWNWRH